MANSEKMVSHPLNPSNVRHDDRTPDKNSKSKSTKSIRKRKRRNSSTDEEEFDTSIDMKLEQSAMRNNLTPQNVKNILQKVVRNDHVLAIVKLKEEELERREQAMKYPHMGNDINTEESKVTENDGVDELDNAVPKLTRAKAKALNKYPLPVAPLKPHSEPDSEVVALIREELHSDDDDDEYQPGEDDIESDDEINTTHSDIDSQPATPSSQIDASEEVQNAVYTHDGLFKIPRLRNDSTTSQSEQEYIIAQRTRSKISLAETPIEAIESTFRAPDAPLDMYQMEPDVDPNWIQFLNNFSMPLTSEIEKDEDADPDYCPMIVDSQPDDREEFQHVNVSKKEVNDLLNDWYSCIDINFLDLNEFDTLTLDTSSSKHPPTATDDLNESLVTPVKQIDEPEPNKYQTPSETAEVPVDSPEIPSNPGISYFDPSAISTPSKPNYINSPTTRIHRTQQQSLNSSNSTLLSVNETTTVHNTSYPYAYSVKPLQDKTSVFVPVMTFTTNSNASPHELTLSYPSSILVTIPSDATSTTPAMPPTMISSIQSIHNSNQMLQMSQQQIGAGQTIKRPGCRAKRSRFKSAVYKELENLDPNTLIPKNDLNGSGFTSEQRLILESHLRIHVQLSTQSYLQTYGHPELYPEAQRVKRFLVEIMEIIDKCESSVSIYNLKPAMELITGWENELSQNTIENTELYTYMQEEMNKLRKNVGYTMQFHERILRLICESKVFIYPELLPAIPFRFKTPKSSEYFPAEDYLLAFLLEHFFEELRKKNVTYRFAKPKEVTLSSVCHNISAHLSYLRHYKSIYDYIRLRRDCEFMNPIKFYFKHKRAPPIRHRYEVFNSDLIIEPAKQPITVLSTQWARYVEKLIGFKHDEVLQKIKTPPNDCEKETKRRTTNENTHNSTNDDKNSLIHVKILYGHSEANQLIHNKKVETGTVHGISDNSEGLIKGQTLLTSYFHPLRKATKDFNHDDEISIEVEEPADLTTDDIVVTDRIYFFWHRKRICKKYRRLRLCKYSLRQRTKLFLVHLISRIRKKFSPHWQRFRRNKNVSFAYRCIISYHLFTTEFINRQSYKISKVPAKMSTEALVTNRRVQKFISSDNASGSHAREMAEENTAAHTVQQQSEVGQQVKRLLKNQRSNDSTRLLLTENAQESSEKDFLFAQRFIDRVEETFINENKHHKFTEFISILRNFSENQQQKTGADLYLTLEKFLMPDYPDLMELFLCFLSPSDAVEINKTMDYFLKVNSTKFLNKLNIFFQKQPAQIRKVLACLKELSEDPDVTIDRIRSKILPLLKGNQLLIDWFIQCVAPDKCDSTKDEYETLVLRKGNESFDADQFEYIPQSEVIADPNENPCHIRYMNGRIFYGNRFPLPAKLSFSATIPCSSDSLEPEKQSVMGSGDKNLHYHCVHNIKDFADSKMRDRHHLEVGNSGPTEDVDNSDDEQHFSIPFEKMDEEDGESVSNHILCDDASLRAHSIRLNPSLHLPVQTKSAHIRKTNSPNAKKMALDGSKSPINKKTVSPLSMTPQNVESGSTVQQESNVIQTAKKLKRILETSDQMASNSCLPNPTDDSSRRVNTLQKKKSHMLSKPIKKQKRAHEYCDSGDDEGETVEEFESKTRNDINIRKIDTLPEIQGQWTREEDRLLLEQIKAGLSMTGLDMNRFPNKTQDQISHRIDFLIDFLTKLRNKQN
ncbi:uncharacterized protein LOC129573467 [Sitodiplosis mosellana]|uniref:uncharacterized protein LOC129573467 n=1 Tax=Sitodiplosis mosellana TaxID=263140 RepID=UPI002444DDC8|nr:uncharacterized protein LOC129573467 [Sitodiplosis mosellana]